jgi:hypothetical protein
MRDSLSIVVRRVPTESAATVRLKIAVTDGVYGGAVDLWPSKAIVRELGSGLAAFPATSPDEFKFYFEEEQETHNITLRAFAQDGGRCTLDLRLARGLAECSLQCSVEAAALNRLGQFFVRLLDSDTQGFRWTPGAADLLDSDELEAV